MRYPLRHYWDQILTPYIEDHLFVANVSDIIWADSFPHLVLGEVEKSLLLGFAKIKLKQTASFDDFVPGKGPPFLCLSIFATRF